MPGARRKRRRRDRQRLSQMLRTMIAGHPEPRMNVWQLRDALSDRAYGVLLFIFALPNILPLPPGLNSLLSILIVFVAVQFVIGLPHPYFPTWLGRRSFERSAFEMALGRVRPQMRWMERLLQPRLLWVTSRTGERVIGLVCIVLALVAALPIPFGHEVPALSICFIALALLERDGLLVLAGLGLGLGSLALYGTFILKFCAPLIHYLAGVFGS